LSHSSPFPDPFRVIFSKMAPEPFSKSGSLLFLFSHLLCSRSVTGLKWKEFRSNSNELKSALSGQPFHNGRINCLEGRWCVAATPCMEWLSAHTVIFHNCALASSILPPHTIWALVPLSCFGLHPTAQRLAPSPSLSYRKPPIVTIHPSLEQLVLQLRGWWICNDGWMVNNGGFRYERTGWVLGAGSWVRPKHESGQVPKLLWGENRTGECTIVKNHCVGPKVIPCIGCCCYTITSPSRQLIRPCEMAGQRVLTSTH